MPASAERPKPPSGEVGRGASAVNVFRARIARAKLEIRTLAAAVDLDPDAGVCHQLVRMRFQGSVSLDDAALLLAAAEYDLRRRAS